MKRSFFSLLVIAIGFLVLWNSTEGLQTVTTEGARRINIAKNPQKIPAFKLQTMSGSDIDLSSNKGKATVIEFIYTTCPTICQSAGANLARLRDRLVEQNLDKKVRVLSISFDPDVDDISQLANYGELHNADGDIWTIARPETSNLDELLRSFGVIVIPDKFGGYEHNLSLHVIDENSNLVAIVNEDDIDGALMAVRKTLN